jgi:hypothetical protein
MSYLKTKLPVGLLKTSVLSFLGYAMIANLHTCISNIKVITLRGIKIENIS